MTPPSPTKTLYCPHLDSFLMTNSHSCNHRMGMDQSAAGLLVCFICLGWVITWWINVTVIMRWDTCLLSVVVSKSWADWKCWQLSDSQPFLVYTSELLAPGGVWGRMTSHSCSAFINTSPDQYVIMMPLSDNMSLCTRCYWSGSVCVTVIMDTSGAVTETVARPSGSILPPCPGAAARVRTTSTAPGKTTIHQLCK